VRVHVQQIQVLGADAVLLNAVAAIPELGPGSVRRIRYFERPCQNEELFRLHTQNSSPVTAHSGVSDMHVSCSSFRSRGLMLQSSIS